MSETEESLRRLESLIAALDRGADTEARRIARSLLEVVLDLHGLALSRIAAILVGAPGGTALLTELADDPWVRAVLLLHGLHPEDTAERVARAVAVLNEALADEGARVRVLGVSASSARLVVRQGDAEPAALRGRIEAAIMDAAPELEELAIEGLDRAASDALPALAT